MSATWGKPIGSNRGRTVMLAIGDSGTCWRCGTTVRDGTPYTEAHREVEHVRCRRADIERYCEEQQRDVDEAMRWAAAHECWMDGYSIETCAACQREREAKAGARPGESGSAEDQI